MSKPFCSVLPRPTTNLTPGSSCQLSSVRRRNCTTESLERTWPSARASEPTIKKRARDFAHCWCQKILSPPAYNMPRHFSRTHIYVHLPPLHTSREVPTYLLLWCLIPHFRHIPFDLWSLKLFLAPYLLWRDHPVILTNILGENLIWSDHLVFWYKQKQKQDILSRSELCSVSTSLRLASPLQKQKHDIISWSELYTALL